MGLLTSDECEKLRELLLKLHNIKTDRATRISLIPDEFRQHVESSDIAHTHIDNIVATIDDESAQRADGSWPIILLIETAIRFDAEGQTAEDLKELLATAQERARNLQSDTCSEEKEQRSLLDSTTSDTPAPQPTVPEVLKPIEEVQGLVKAEIARFIGIKNTLESKPSWFKLQRIDSSSTQSDEVLAKLYDDIKQGNDIFAELSDDAALEWIIAARKEAEAASKFLNECFQQIAARNLPSAQKKINAAIQAYEQLNRRLKKFLKEQVIDMDKDPNPSMHETKEPVHETSAETAPRYHDTYSPYEIGMETLLSRLGQAHPRYVEALTYQQRLNDTIAKSRQFGDTETARAERAAIVAQLNSLALSALGISFNDLMPRKTE